MATEADVLRSITAILQSGERREQYKVQSALAMMQFAAQQRQRDIAQTQANLELVSKSVQQQKPQVAAEFLAGTTGIGFVENVARKYMQYEVIWITIFVMGMLGLLFDVTIRKIIDKTIPWRGKG